MACYPPAVGEILGSPQSPRIQCKPSADDEELLCKLPRPPQGLLSFARVFDDVDDIPDIDDWGRLQFIVWPVNRIPPGPLVTGGAQESQIVPKAAAVIEEGAVV